MSKEIIVALIGAVGSAVTAWIAKPSTKKGHEKVETRRSFRTTWTFILIVAPIVGAIVLFGLFRGFRVLADARSIRAPFCISGFFYPSGWMGDAEKGIQHVQLNDQWKENCHSGPSCVRIIYQPGVKGWAGVYWQPPDSNWGDLPGRKIEGATKLVFWARGQNGGELIQFKSGGMRGKKYEDSYEKVLDTVALRTDWQQFEIPLKGADTTSVIGAFSWTARANAPLTFYLDGICFQ
jgi:hypothetical protein